MYLSQPLGVRGWLCESGGGGGWVVIIPVGVIIWQGCRHNKYLLIQLNVGVISSVFTYNPMQHAYSQNSPDSVSSIIMLPIGKQEGDTKAFY